MNDGPYGSLSLANPNLPSALMIAGVPLLLLILAFVWKSKVTEAKISFWRVALLLSVVLCAIMYGMYRFLSFLSGKGF